MKQMVKWSNGASPKMECFNVLEIWLLAHCDEFRCVMGVKNLTFGWEDPRDGEHFLIPILLRDTCWSLPSPILNVRVCTRSEEEGHRSFVIVATSPMQSSEPKLPCPQ